MRHLLLIVLFFPPILANAQVRQDTTFSAEGTMLSIKYLSKLETEGMKKSDLFMRGLSPGDEAWELDSLRIFDEQGNLRNTTTLADYMATEGRKGRNTATAKVQQPRPPRDFIEHSTTLFIKNTVNVTGYTGETVSDSLRIWNGEQKELRLALKYQPKNIEVAPLPATFVKGANAIPFTATLTAGTSSKIIQFTGPDNKSISIKIAMRGYDLSEADFTRTDEQLPFFDASEREYLFLRLQSTEKLLNLYQGERLLYNIPVGRELDQLPVYHLPAGKYRMEVIDLSSGQKRAYGLKR